MQKNTNQFFYARPSTVNGEYTILSTCPHENDNPSQNDDENDDRYSHVYYVNVLYRFDVMVVSRLVGMSEEEHQICRD